MAKSKIALSARPLRLVRSQKSKTNVELAIRYLESSAVAAALLESDDAARASLREAGKRVTSALTIAEVSRAIIRARIAGRLSSDQERAAFHGLQLFSRRCNIVSVAEIVLSRAGRPFPIEPVRTLDAIHLATVEALGASPALVTVVTRDIRVRDNATALGYRIE